MSDETPLPPVPPARPSKELLQPEPSPPAAEPASSAPRETAFLTGFLRQRLELIEGELAKERERAREAEHLLRQQETLRVEADRQLKEILERLKAEKAEREREDQKSHAQGRVDALEKRLDETHAAWAGLLKEALAKRDAGSERLAVEAAANAAGLRALNESLAAAREELAALKESQGRFPAGLEQMISRFGAVLTDRLADMDRRLAMELQRHEDAAAAWTRERTAFSEAIEEQRHQIRQEYAKERMALQARFQEQLEEFKRTLQKLEKGREGDSQAISELRELAAKTHEVLSRPEKAKDQLLGDLEQEKRDLLKALQDRTAALRAYTLERREAERSLGESLMDSNRKLEAERSKEQGYQSRIAELERRLESAQRQEKLVEAMSSERDGLLQSLAAAAQKLQQAAAAGAESERALEARIEEAGRRAEEEKAKRVLAERRSSELEAKLQTLGDHTAEILRDKEKTQSLHAQWKEEREKFLAELRKKEELLSMLSTTFQALLKK